MYKNTLHNIKIKNFNLMIINSGISRFGFSSFDLIIIWVILFITKSPILSGIGDGILSAPLFISFVVGAYIDKFNRKKFLAIMSSIARSLSITFIFIGILLNNTLIIILSIYLSAFLIGFTSDILNSIRASWIKEFLSEDQYKKGVSLSNTVYSMAEGIGYITSGILISFGTFFSFFAMFIVFAISIIPLIFIKISDLKKKENTKIIGTVLEGLVFIKENNPVWQIMIIAFIGNLIFGMAGIIFVALVQIGYKLPAIFISLIFGIFVFGIILGSIVASKIKGKLGKISIISYLIIGVSMISVYFIKNIYLVLIPSMAIGIVSGIVNVAAGSAILKIIPQELMARVQGAFSTFSMAILSISGFMGGIIIQIFGTINSFIFIGFVIIVISPLFLLLRDIYSVKI